MNQSCILRSCVKFIENRIIFDPCLHIKPPLDIQVYAYKWLTNISIVMKFGMNVYFVNLHMFTKFCNGRSRNATRFKIGLLMKICLEIIISLKILLSRRNSTCLIRKRIILPDFIMTGT